MKKNGFVSTTVIYTFFIIFLMLMLFLLNSYTRVRFLLEEFKRDIKEDIANESLADINLYIMVWDPVTNEYKIKESVPTIGYVYEPKFSYCKNSSSLSYINGNISVTAQRRDSCYVYFKEAEQDITLKIYTKESEDAEARLVSNIPNNVYRYSFSNCTNGATLNWNDSTRKITISSSQKTVCEVYFTKIEMDIILNLYKEDANGSHEFNGVMYSETSTVPGSNYVFDTYSCKNNLATITIDDATNALLVESPGKDECDVYFKGGNDKVEIIIMQETETGVNGYTTGKKYSRTYSIPGSGYAYVGYICDSSDAKITYTNGTLYGEGTTQSTCRAYFNKYSDNVLINYYLEKSDGTYESVSSIPSLGYIYNKDKSNCQNGSTIKVENNVVYVSASTNDVCNVYFDLADADIKVLVYVMDRTTQKYELSSVPTVGYDLYNAGCTGGASIEYKNGSLTVTSDGPTVCTVYFR